MSFINQSFIHKYYINITIEKDIQQKNREKNHNNFGQQQRIKYFINNSNSFTSISHLYN